MTNKPADPGNADASADTDEQRDCEGNDPLASVPLHWAQTRGVRKRNPNGCLGWPGADFAAQWAKTARCSDIRTPDELCAVLDHALSRANEISSKNGTDWEWWSYLTFRVDASARMLAPRLQHWRIAAHVDAPASDLKATPDSEEFARPNIEIALEAKAFLAWWRRLPEARRVRYGSVCSPAAISDFTRSHQPIHNLAESQTSTSGDRATCPAASGEANAAHGDTLQSGWVSRSHMPSATAEEGSSLRSHSQTGMCGTQDEASNAWGPQRSQLETSAGFGLAGDAHPCERGE